MDIWKDIGQQLKQVRTQKGMTQSELGEKIGAGKQYISNIETGSRPCSVRKLQEISAVLDCSLVIHIKKTGQ